MTQGIDYTGQTTDAIAKAIVKAGKSFVMRYFADPKYGWKCLTPAEAKVLIANHIQFATVYEDSADDMRYGFGRGVEDARNYLTMARACGQPNGSAAYFAADFDASGKDFDLIEQYLKGVKSILPQFKIRPYGEFDVIEEMVRRGVCDGGWQTYAWSGGKRSTHAFIYQYKNGQPVAEMSVDLNESFGNEGFWNPPARMINSLSITKIEDTSITVALAADTPFTVYAYYLDDVWKGQSSDKTFTFEGLSPNTKYTISVKGYLQGWREPIAMSGTTSAPEPIADPTELEKITAAVKIIAAENGVADPDFWITNCVKGTPIDGAYVGSLIKNMGRIITRLKG